MFGFCFAPIVGWFLKPIEGVAQPLDSPTAPPAQTTLFLPYYIPPISGLNTHLDEMDQSFEMMSAQRFDLPKRPIRRPCSMSTVDSAYIGSHGDSATPTPITNVNIKALNPRRSQYLFDSDTSSYTSAGSFTVTSPRMFGPSSTSSITFVGGDVDGEEREECHTTQTFIRSAAVRSSSRLPLGSSDSKIRITLAKVVNRLLCFRNAAFEEEVDYLEHRRWREAEGMAGVVVQVTREREQHVEDIWREGAQKGFYDPDRKRLQPRRRRRLSDLSTP